MCFDAMRTSHCSLTICVLLLTLPQYEQLTSLDFNYLTSPSTSLMPCGLHKLFIQRFGDTIPLLHLGSWSFVGSLAALYLLTQEVGFISAMAGASTIFVYMCVQLWFARQFASRRGITAKVIIVICICIYSILS
jgi:hypothetical protein